MRDEGRDRVVFFNTHEFHTVMGSCVEQALRGYVKIPFSLGEVAMAGEVGIECGGIGAAICLRNFLDPSQNIEGSERHLIDREVLLIGRETDYLELYRRLTQRSDQKLGSDNQDLLGEVLNISHNLFSPLARHGGAQVRGSFPQTFIGPVLEKLLKRLSTEAPCFKLSDGKRIFWLVMLAGRNLGVSWKFDVEN